MEHRYREPVTCPVAKVIFARVPEKPHGLDYSLTLHEPDGGRLVGFDNAHPVAGQRRGEPQDHRHRLRRITAYDTKGQMK